MAIHKTYFKEVSEEFGYKTVWLPGTPLELGQIGVLSKSGFIPYGSLRENFNLDINADLPSAPIPYKYASAGAICFSTKNNIKVNSLSDLKSPVDIENKVTMEFTKNKAVMLDLHNARSTRLNILNLSEALTKLYQDKAWNLNHVVVSEIVQPELAAIFVSENKGSTVDFQISADASVDGYASANINLDFDMSSYKGLSFQCHSKRGLTPLIQVVGLRKKFFSGTRITHHSLEEHEQNIENMTVDTIPNEEIPD